MRFRRVILLAGILSCASHNPPKTTSAGGGASSAASGPSAPPRTRSIKVVDYQTGNPVSAQHAISDDADGGLVAEGDTGVDGVITLAEPPGGSISLLWSMTSTPQGHLTIDHPIDTLVDPPDTVVTIPIFATPVSVPAQNEPMSQLNVTVNSVPPEAKSVLVNVSCGAIAMFSQLSPASPNPHQTYSQYRGCPGNHSFGAIAIAFNSANDIVATGSLSNQLLQSGATVSIGLVLTPAPSYAFDAAMYNVPPDATRDGIGLNGARDDGTSFQAAVTQAVLPIPPVLSLHVGTPTGFSTHWDVLFDVERGTLAGAEVRLAPDHFPLALSFDYNGLADLVTPGRDLSDLAHPAISWEMGPGPTGNGVSVIQPRALGSSVNVTWTAVTSANETKARFPTLPAAYESWLLVPGAAVREAFLRHSRVPGADLGAWMSTEFRRTSPTEESHYVRIPSN